MLPHKHTRSVAFAAPFHRVVLSVYAEVQACAAAVVPPPVLYHFTDTAGFLGIVDSGQLWGSLATGLNDAGEIAHGVELARRVCSEWKGDAATFAALVGDMLSPGSWDPDLLIEADAYVASFCASSERALQWLHYGRAGSGFALGFSTQAMRHEPFRLAPVVYDLSRQREFIHRIINTAWLQTTQNIVDVPEAERAHFREFCAQSTAQEIWASSCYLKDAAFAHEEEWRLLTYELSTDEFPPSPESRARMHFRSVASRIVPYQAYPIGTLISEIVIGNATPIEDGDLGLRTLLRHRLTNPPTVRRSSIRVRP
jgi:hypothetical protein